VALRGGRIGYAVSGLLALCASAYAEPPADAAPPRAPSPAPSAPSGGVAFGQFGSPIEVAAPDDRPTTPAVPPPISSGPKPKIPRFGDAGQFAILAESGIGLTSSSYSNSSASAFNVAFEPSVEYFVVRNFSIGVELDLSHSSDRSYVPGALVDTKYTLLGGGVHFGLNVPFAKVLSVYPLLMVGVHHIEQTAEVIQGNPGPLIPADSPAQRLSRTGPWLSFELPLLYHPVEHFFVGLGPAVYHDFSHAEGGYGTWAERTSLGGTFVLGGYFDPRPKATNPDDPSLEDSVPPVDQRRFGDPGTVVLTEESSFSWRAQSYAGDVPTRNTFAIAGGFDWFFMHHQSLGLAAFYSTTGRYSSGPGEPLLTNATGVGVSARYGFVVPFSSWFSLYPRMSFEYSVATVDVTSGASRSIREHSHIVQASIFVPATVHLTTHFFIGFGPSVSVDIVHTVDGGPEPRRTAFGVSSLLGGWL